MPQVPRYDNFQVDERALPAARQETIASPELLGAESKRAMQRGDALLSAGTQLNAVAIKMQEQENLRTVQSAAASYQDAAQKFQLEVREKRRNAAAAGVVTSFDDWHEKQVKGIVDGLQNDAQKQAFGVLATKNRLAIRHDLGTYEIGEGRKANDAAFDSDVKTLIGNGAIAITDVAAAEFRNALVNRVNAYSGSQGYNEEQKRAVLGERLTAFHEQRLQQLTKGDRPEQAEAYFNANKQEIDGSRHAELGEFAVNATATATGNKAADNVWKTMGPKNYRDPVALDKMEEQLRTELKGKEKAIDIGVKELRQRHQAFSVGRTESDAQFESAIIDKLRKGTPPNKIPEMAEVSPKKAYELEDAYNRHVTGQLSRANAAEVRNEQLKKRKGLGAYWQYSQPEVLAGMSENQISALWPTLGGDLTDSLISQKRSLAKSADKIIEARMDQQDFDHVANELGLKPFANAKTEEQKAMLGELKFVVEKRIDAAQRDKGKQLTREEKMELMGKVMDDKVMKRNTFWSDEKMPTALLNKEQQKTAYVTVDGEKVTLSSIDANFRIKAAAALQKLGVAPTEESIATMWARSRKPTNTLK